MAGQIYKELAREMFDGLVSFKDDAFRVTLVDMRRYTPSIDSGRTIADIPPDARLQTITLTNVRLDDGDLYCDDWYFPAAGREGEEIPAEFVMWLDSGDEATSRLISISAHDIHLFGGYLQYLLDGKPFFELPPPRQEIASPSPSVLYCP